MPSALAAAFFRRSISTSPEPGSAAPRASRPSRRTVRGAALAGAALSLSVLGVGTHAADPVQELRAAVYAPDASASPPPADPGLGKPAGLSSARCEWPSAEALGAVLPIATDSGSHASGVVFAHGRVLTAAHAVQGAGRFFVRTGADFRQARLVVVDHEQDLAVLSVDTGGIAPLPLAAADPGAAEPVWAVGFPRAEGLSLSSGVFQKRRDGALHTSASIDSGQSGGGLLACERGRYRLAGMLRGYGAYLAGDRYVKLENHSVSVAATTIHRFLADYR